MSGGDRSATVVPVRTYERGVDALAASTLPASVKAGLAMYLDRHRRPGDFLRAVLSNNLAQAVLQRTADVDLDVLVRWLWAYGPPGSWGSPAIVDAWLSKEAT